MSEDLVFIYYICILIKAITPSICSCLHTKSQNVRDTDPWYDLIPKENKSKCIYFFGYLQLVDEIFLFEPHLLFILLWVLH